MSAPTTAVMHFSGASTGSAAVSQVVIIEVANYITVDVVGLRRYHYELDINNWRVTDVEVVTSPSPAAVIITSASRGTTKNSTINVDLTNDPDAEVTVTLNFLGVATEYPIPPLFVQGPDNEQVQYENPGQWYHDIDNNSIEIYIP